MPSINQTFKSVVILFVILSCLSFRVFVIAINGIAHIFMLTLMATSAMGNFCPNMALYTTGIFHNGFIALGGRARTLTPEIVISAIIGRPFFRWDYQKRRSSRIVNVELFVKVHEIFNWGCKEQILNKDLQSVSKCEKVDKFNI